MISIVLNTERAAKTMVENTKIFHFAVSLGGVESLIEHVPSMTHGNWAMSEEVRSTTMPLLVCCTHEMLSL